ncbi:MAG: hypothetical protein ACYC18_10840 [Gammaproteobacteria bacterium]
MQPAIQQLGQALEAATGPFQIQRIQARLVQLKQEAKDKKR